MIVCLQSGNVNTGACDDLRAAIASSPSSTAPGSTSTAPSACGRRANPRHAPPGRRRRTGRLLGHRRPQVAQRPLRQRLRLLRPPRDARAGRRWYTAPYLTGSGAHGYAASDLTLESSRRARGFATWAALQQLGRSGVADLVERCCRLARRFATQLRGKRRRDRQRRRPQPGARELRQTTSETDRVIDAVQRDGTCWMGGTDLAWPAATCASRSRTGRPPRTTSTGRWRRYCAAPADGLAAAQQTGLRSRDGCRPVAGISVDMPVTASSRSSSRLRRPPRADRRARARADRAGDL